MRISIDAMGGDHAPKEIVLGAQQAIEKFPDLEIVLVGDETKIAPFLTNKERITVMHTEEQILGTDEPVRAVRRKKDASLVLAYYAYTSTGGTETDMEKWIESEK